MSLLGRVLRTRPTRVDRWAITVLVVLPMLINLPFAMAGHPLMAGDNLTQNFPLRVLSGELLGHGRLPLWNPDIWSGAPLLAGWNAAAMFPGTWLFAVVPGVAAFELNVIAVGLIGGLGLYVFVRRQGCSALASLLAALTFSYTGFMNGQSVHLGLVTGMAFAPWVLVSLDQMAESRTRRESCRAVALLGLCGGLVVLAGDPRAITNDAVVAIAYVTALLWRKRRSAGAWDWRLLGTFAAGGVLADRALGRAMASWARVSWGNLSGRAAACRTSACTHSREASSATCSRPSSSEATGASAFRPRISTCPSSPTRWG